MAFWNEFYEIFLKYWITVFIPIAAWLNKKRVETIQLTMRVEALESKLDDMSDQLNEDRVERKTTSDKIDKIYDVVMQVKEDTAVNKAKIEAKSK